MRPLLTASVLLACSAWSFSALADNLADVYQAAVENDPAMRAAEAEYRSQYENKNIARGALLPQLSLDASYGYADQETKVKKGANDVAIQLGTKNTYGTQWTAGLTLTQQLININSWYAFKGGKELSKQAEIKFIDNQQDLISRTVQAYFEVLRAHSNLSSSIAEEKAMKQQLDQMQQRFDVGLVAITDVNEAQAAYDMANVGLIANEGNLQIAYQALSVLTGKNYESVDILAKDFPVVSPEPADMQEWVSKALQNNPKIKLAESSVSAAEYQAKSAKASHYPVLALQGKISTSNTKGKEEYPAADLKSRAESDQDTWSIGLGLSMPLYSGGSVGAKRRQAYAQYDMAKENTVGTERVVTQQTRSQFIAALTSMQTVSARKQAIVSAESALDAIQSGYDVGTRNIVDVLNAQRNLFAAQRDYHNARYDYINSMIELKYLAGILSPDDINHLNEWLVANN